MASIAGKMSRVSRVGVGAPGSLEELVGDNKWGIIGGE